MEEHAEHAEKNQEPKDDDVQGRGTGQMVADVTVGQVEVVVRDPVRRVAVPG